MIDLTGTASQKLLFESRYREAVPAAMQCLRFTIDLHGLASIELVPAYLMLSEASIGLLYFSLICSLFMIFVIDFLL